MPLVVLIAGLAMFSQPLMAQEGAVDAYNTIAYCPPDTRFAPDGLVLKLGGEYFRVCSQWSGEPGQRQELLVINPDIVEGLTYATSATVIRLDERHPGDNFPTFGYQLEFVAKRAKKAPNRLFGNYEYEAYFSDNIGDNGLPGIGKYFYLAEINPGKPLLPPHLVSCIGEASIPLGTVSCRVRVWFPKFMAAKLFIGSSNFGAIPTDRFPETALDIVRIVEAAIVTDRLQEMARFLDVIE